MISENCIMWKKLALSKWIVIIVLIAVYFIINWTKNGIKEAYTIITGTKTTENIKNEK